MASRARNKLTVKQVASLSKPNVYSDGGGLYLRVRASGRSWFYIGTLDGKRIELGLGPALDVPLAKARTRALPSGARHVVQRRLAVAEQGHILEIRAAGALQFGLGLAQLLRLEK